MFQDQIWQFVDRVLVIGCGEFLDDDNFTMDSGTDMTKN